MVVRIGIVGTSWWADSMYLPALKRNPHPYARVVAVCGRDYQRLQDFAQRWDIPETYTDYHHLIDSGSVDALIVATANDTHYPITMSALDAGLHVLCDKPLAQNYEQAGEMAARAKEVGVKTMVPFTYRYMPTTRYIKTLIDDGFIGLPYHLNMRYYTGYGREAKYDWRFDADIAGAGVLADLGPHWFHVARWIFGEVTSLSAYTETFIQRPNAPHDRDYTRADDSTVITVRFASGAYGVLQMTTVAYEGTKFGQTHHMEFHGSEGTLYNYVDWETTQEVKGVRVGGRPDVLGVPDTIWMGARHDTVHNTYRDIFREQNHMTREWVTAIAENRPCTPDFDEGARVQQLIEASIRSAKARCWIDV